MNFMEYLYGVSPDGGDGTFEALLLLAPLLLLLLALRTRAARLMRDRSRSARSA
jgi:hypothetical protein